MRLDLMHVDAEGKCAARDGGLGHENRDVGLSG